MLLLMDLMVILCVKLCMLLVFKKGDQIKYKHGEIEGQ